MVQWLFSGHVVGQFQNPDFWSGYCTRRQREPRRRLASWEIEEEFGRPDKGCYVTDIDSLFGIFPQSNSVEKAVDGLIAVADSRQISENDCLNSFENTLKWFSVPANSIACLIRKRWPDGIVLCPTCGRKDARYLASRGLWQCKTRHPQSQFSIRSGTIFEDSHLPLGLWLAAIWIIANGELPSSREVACRLGITQKSAWSMLRRVKCGWQDTAGMRNSQSQESVRDRKSGLLPWD